MILTWHTFTANGNQYSIGPTYYMDGDYEPVAVRVYAEVAPDVEDAEFNIYDDGVTIFADRASHTYYMTPPGGIQTLATPVTNALLSIDQTSEDIAGDFRNDIVIEEGSWVSCNLVKDGGGKNFTIQLELVPL